MTLSATSRAAHVVPAPSATQQPTPLVRAPAEGALVPVYKRQPVEFVRGQGVELFDGRGSPYLDFTSGIAVNALGYGDPGLTRVMHEAAEGLVHVSNLYHTAPARLLAAALVERSCADAVFFCNSGAEANEGAFKFARRWARSVGGDAKHEIVALRGGFHGRLFASLAATDRPGYRAPFRPLAGGVTIAERDLDALAVLLDPETVAAVILEPVQGEGGVRVLDAEFLRRLRALTRERGILLIADEIQCGLGRTGALFAYEHAGIDPDLITLAKPLAGGLPIGAVLASRAVVAAVRPGDHGTTFGGGPFVTTVALHVLQRVGAASFLEHVRETGSWLGGQLVRLAGEVAGVRAVRGVGFMWGLDTAEPAADVVARALDAGLLVLTAGEHTLRLLPPLVATHDELARGLAILREVL
ncbi:MAG TPA: acetylornithine/succinylornithine family transaminase [Gemmatimonadaceae bacterium]|nr:acetylornithine/succinylornithine family transaminase [Gemmatimonadaceae bacterium]